MTKYICIENFDSGDQKGKLYSREFTKGNIYYITTLLNTFRVIYTESGQYFTTLDITNIDKYLIPLDIFRQNQIQILIDDSESF